MRQLTSKHYAFYIIFGFMVHFFYGLFCHYYFTTQGEPLMARWPGVCVGLCFGFWMLFFPMNHKTAEKIFFFLVSLVTLNYLYLVDLTKLDAVYLQGIATILIGCSLLIMSKRVLVGYLAITFFVALIVIFRKSDEIYKLFQIMNLFCLCFFIFITSIFKINILEALDLARKQSQEAKVSLERNYKLNLQAAHDLASPISAIRVASDKIKYDAPASYKLLESSIEQIKNISAELLIDHQNKKEELEVDFFDLENSISQIIRDKRQEYKDVSHFFIMYRVTAPVIGQVKLPKTEFYRVLSNIINNGVDAMENQVEKRMKIVIDPRSKDISLLISDNGPGIPRERESEIFKENVSFKRQGAGIGLSFAKKKVEEWGGEIHLKSTGPSGTTFELIIPYA